jgi:hypothetical protein
MVTQQQKWYNKATVQSALVNSIPALLTAIVGIAGLLLTWNLSNKQLNQAFSLYEKQMHRDSLLNQKQNELTIRQLELNKKEVILVEKQTKQDSINLSYSKNQNDILNKRINYAYQQEWYDFKDICLNLYETFNSLSKLTKNDTSIWKIKNMLNTKGEFAGQYWQVDFSKCTSEMQHQWSKEVLNVLKIGLKNEYLNNNIDILDKWKICINDMNTVFQWSSEDYKDLIAMSSKDIEKSFGTNQFNYFYLGVFLPNHIKLFNCIADHNKNMK